MVALCRRSHVLPFVKAVPDIEARCKSPHVEFRIGLEQGLHHERCPWPIGAGEESGVFSSFADQSLLRIFKALQQRLRHGLKGFRIISNLNPHQTRQTFWCRHCGVRRAYKGKQLRHVQMSLIQCRTPQISFRISRLRQTRHEEPRMAEQMRRRGQCGQGRFRRQHDTVKCSTLAFCITCRICNEHGHPFA